MVILIIEIHGYFYQVLLTGEKYSKQQLKQIYMQAKELSCENKDLPNVFCKLSNYEELPYDGDIQVAYVIDIDTDRIYSPTY